MEVVNALIATSSGMFAVWDVAAFEHITDYDEWESSLLEDEDIIRQIEAGHLVPVNIQSDGAFQFVVRVGEAQNPETLSDRERQYLVASSESYLLVSQGKIAVSGIERIERDVTDDTPQFNLPDGRYSALVSLIDWASEPGMKGAEGNPSPEALPDFVVLLNPEVTGQQIYRSRIQTFDRA